MDRNIFIQYVFRFMNSQNTHTNDLKMKQCSFSAETPVTVALMPCDVTSMKFLKMFLSIVNFDDGCQET